ncbi:MAG TPA: hypothetical protein VJ911_06195, partial [Cryomorphaceae bacterium]|nr:hypothetical protein [Cryomorphaceae bacterium]
VYDVWFCLYNMGDLIHFASRRPTDWFTLNPKASTCGKSIGPGILLQCFRHGQTECNVGIEADARD